MAADRLIVNDITGFLEILKMAAVVAGMKSAVLMFVQ